MIDRAGAMDLWWYEARGEIVAFPPAKSFRLERNPMTDDWRLDADGRSHDVPYDSVSRRACYLALTPEMGRK